MLSCKEVSHDLLADEHKSAGIGRRIAIRVHLLMCDNCRRFAAQLQRMNETMRELRADGDRASGDDEAAQRILERVRKARTSDESTR
jgi:predicted anti-sigma-YlaC factor YlaD